ncbi:CD5 antigen-like isoform X1 [Ambystoma mexicanum]|uniref:CD5 antigen-like isoform X1 n=1 Tax=Ambystoma mexicanum TaxID=8296 RepID=UPI0037E95893
MLVSAIILLHIHTVYAGCPDCVDADRVRLLNGANTCAGTVLVSLTASWGTICDSQWDIKDATVVCRQLGCGVPHSAPGRTRLAVANTPIAMTNVQCTGHEPSLLKCEYSTDVNSNCNTTSTADVHCSGPDIVQLVNGPSHCSGRVEVRYNGVWGAVCDDSWDQVDASIVCRQLGCALVQSYTYNSSFGTSSWPVLMSNVQCTADDFALWECAQRGWEHHNCPTGRDAGVTCTGGADELRLVNAGDTCRGRLEVKHQNRWATVCDHGWDEKDAEVVCRQLGCGSALKAESNNQPFGKGSWPILLSNVECTGLENSLFGCPHTNWGYNDCRGRRDAGVVCSERRVLDPTINKVSVSVDPSTANRFLIVSSDGKEVTSSSSEQKLPPGPGRFENEKCVLGSAGVTSGRRYWEVAILPARKKPSGLRIPVHRWTLGVAQESVKRKGRLNMGPEDGIWALNQSGVYLIVLSDPEQILRLPRSPLTKLGIYQDFEGGLVSFYDAESSKHLFTFTASFTGRTFPYICADSGTHMQLV